MALRSMQDRWKTACRNTLNGIAQPRQKTIDRDVDPAPRRWVPRACDSNGPAPAFGTARQVTAGHSARRHASSFRQSVAGMSHPRKASISSLTMRQAPNAVCRQAHPVDAAGCRSGKSPQLIARPTMTKRATETMTAAQSHSVGQCMKESRERCACSAS